MIKRWNFGYIAVKIGVGACACVQVLEILLVLLFRMYESVCLYFALFLSCRIAYA